MHLKFIDGNDVFASLPTGYGKSLIYGLLPETFNEIRGQLAHDQHNSCM